MSGRDLDRLPTCPISRHNYEAETKTGGETGTETVAGWFSPLKSPMKDVKPTFDGDGLAQSTRKDTTEVIIDRDLV